MNHRRGCTNRNPGAEPARWRRGRSGGVVLVLALLSLVLLSALVFYVFNTGRHVNHRIEVQNAADAAAISGAGWVARSFNTVAMNNVEIARMIALASVMDAVPQAVDYTLQDQTALLRAIDGQLTLGVGADPWLADGLEEARSAVIRQLELLTPMHELFNESGYDVAAMTHYRGVNDTRGSLWLAIESLAALNVATMENLGLLAQFSAFRGAQINQREGGKSAGGLLLPWVPEVAWEQGAFEDFEPPVVQGLLPIDQDDKVINRGPFDTLFGFWRFRADIGRVPIGVQIEQDYSLTDWSAPQPPTERIVERTATGYLTWGAFTDMRANAMSLGVGPEGISREHQSALTDPADIDLHPLVPSLWARRIAFISDHKINFAFPGSAQANIVRDPRWITNYEQAKAIQENGDPEIHYAMYMLFTFIRDEFDGTLPGEPTFDNWALIWPDDSELDPPGLAKVANHIWRDDRIEVVSSGHRQRYIRYYVFAGANIGDAAVIRNPNNFDDEDRNTMPGPVNFTAETFVANANGQIDNAVRREGFTYLGLAHQPKEATFMPERFDDDRTDSRYVALAQAEVFNNHSWDLWTQMWHAQLVRVDDYGGWMTALEDPEETDQMPWLNIGDVTDVAEYLRAVQPLADLMVEH